MKKWLMILAVLLAAATLCACGAQSSSASVTEAEAFIEGQIEDATLSSLILVDAASGAKYLFDATDAAVTGADSLQEGDIVHLFYKGALVDGQSMQPVTVERINVTQSSAASAPANGIESPVAGSVIDATMNTITITTADGLTLTFGTEDAVVNSEDGIIIGDEVEIYFDGTANPAEQVQTVQVGTIDVTVPVARPAQSGGSTQPVAQPAPAANPNPPVDYISGTVIDASMNTVKIESIYGNQYQFATGDVSVEGGSLSNGETVAVYFSGTLDASNTGAQPVTVTRIAIVGGAPSQGTNTVGNTPQGDVKVIEGTVDVVDTGSIMMSDATGVDYLFDISLADVHSGSTGIQAGDYVTVYYIGTIVGKPDVQDVQVTQVVVHH